MADGKQGLLSLTACAACSDPGSRVPRAFFRVDRSFSDGTVPRLELYAYGNKLMTIG